MSHRYLAELAACRLPMFVTAPNKLRRLRRLAGAGHVEARFYPPNSDCDQFGEVRALTLAGRNVLAARASSRNGSAAR